MAKPPPSDHVDQITAQWERERPELDVSAMEIIGRLARLSKMIQPLLEEAFARHDLESWEFDVLATLLRSGEPHQLTPGALLESTMVTSGAMTNRIDRLEKRGLVSRTKDPTDGRQVLVALTVNGMKVVDAALLDHTQNELEIISALGPRQRTQLVNLLRQLSHSLGHEA